MFGMLMDAGGVMKCLSCDEYLPLVCFDPDVVDCIGMQAPCISCTPAELYDFLQLDRPGTVGTSATSATASATSATASSGRQPGRTCASCGSNKAKAEFSKNQLAKKKKARCKACVSAKRGVSGGVSSSNTAQSNGLHWCGGCHEYRPLANFPAGELELGDQAVCGRCFGLGDHDLSPAPATTTTTTTAPVTATGGRRCHACGQHQPETMYSNNQVLKYGVKARCRTCVSASLPSGPAKAVPKRLCKACGTSKPETEFSNNQRLTYGENARCKACVRAQRMVRVVRVCPDCRKEKEEMAFSDIQWCKGERGRCRACASSGQGRTCATCKVVKKRKAFTLNQWHKPIGVARCKPCVKASLPKRAEAPASATTTTSQPSAAGARVCELGHAFTSCPTTRTGHGKGVVASIRQSAGIRVEGVSSLAEGVLRGLFGVSIACPAGADNYTHRCLHMLAAGTTEELMGQTFKFAGTVLPRNSRFSVTVSGSTTLWELHHVLCSEFGLDRRAPFVFAIADFGFFTLPEHYGVRGPFTLNAAKYRVQEIWRSMFLRGVYVNGSVVVDLGQVDISCAGRAWRPPVVRGPQHHTLHRPLPPLFPVRRSHE